MPVLKIVDSRKLFAGRRVVWSRSDADSQPAVRRSPLDSFVDLRASRLPAGRVVATRHDFECHAAQRRAAPHPADATLAPSRKSSPSTNDLSLPPLRTLVLVRKSIGLVECHR